MKKLVWTEGYRPFILGGDCNAPVGIYIEVGEKIPVGRGYFVYVVVNPKTGRTHCAESRSGAFVGDSVEMVRKDIMEGDEAAMKEQVKTAIARRAKVNSMKEDEFWQMFKCNS